MSSEAHKARVGVFVVGAVALFMLGLAFLGGKKFFSDNKEYVLYFDGSVSGLSIGAPVVFRGVPLGAVTKINLVANARDEGVTIPVYIRIDEAAIVRLGDSPSLTDAMREEIIRRMVQRGLRARLQLQSLITGQYRVELDFFPDTPARYHSSDHENEIPTVPSPLDEIQRTLSRLPLESIITSLRSAMDGFARLVNSEELYASIHALKNTLENMEKMTADAIPMRESARKMLDGLSATINTVDKQLPEAMASFQVAMTGFAAAAAQMQRTLASADGLVARDSRTVREFNQALKEFNDTARAVRSLCNMLERHPESLLRGKGGGRP